MATDKKGVETSKKDDQTPEKHYHEAIISVNVGSKANGTAKDKITKGDRLTLTDKQVESYRAQKIIK